MRCGPALESSRRARRWRGMAAIAWWLATPALAGSITLPAMPMADALLALARLSGRNILFTPDNVSGLRARAVHAGSFDQALRQMTGGSALRIVREPGGAVMLVRDDPAIRSGTPARGSSPHSPPSRSRATGDVILVNGVEVREGFAYPDPLAFRSLISVADARRLPDRTLAEALGRVPGVLTLSTSLEGSMGGIDHASRAEGDFIAARGLHGGYIETRIDGITMPQNLPYSRGTELGMLPADGFTQVAVVKMLGPDHAGNADAAVIDIANPAPRDPSVQGLHIHAQGGLDERSLRYGQDGASAGGGFTWGGELAGGRLAFVLGADIARRAFSNIEQTYQSGNVEYAVTDAAGRSAPGLDPARNLLLTSLNAEVTRGWSVGGGVRGGLDFQVNDAFSLFARFSYASEHIRQDIYQIGFQGGRDSSYVECVPIGDGLYRTVSVKSELHYWYETNPEKSRLMLGQFGGRWQGERGEIVARAFVASGETGRPDHMEISFWGPQATRLDGGLVLDREGLFPVPALTARDKAPYDGVMTAPVHNEGEDQRQHSRDTRLGGDAVVRRRPESGALRAWEAGVDLVASRRSQWLRDVTYSNTYPAGTTLARTGLVSGTIRALLPGIYDYAVPLIDNARLMAALRGSTPDPLSADGYNGNTIFGREWRGGGHASARFAWGTWELEPGLRLQFVRIANRYWLSGNDGIPADGVPYGWNRDARTYRAALPSLMARWQPNGRLSVRAGLWRSQTQPSDHQLAGGASVEEQADGTRIVEQGNPRLKAVDAVNLDIAAEWSGPQGASVSVAGFAKRLDHYLFDMGNSFGATIGQTEGNVRIVQPRNGGHADIRGLELSARWPLAAIAAPLAGWTLGGEVTLLDSRAHLRVPELDRVEHAQYAPGHDAALRLGYARGRLSMDAALHWVGAYVQQYGLFGTSLGTGASLNGTALDEWVRPSRRLDFSIACDIGRRATLRLTVRNALDDIAYRATLGRYSDAVPETVVSGRQFGLRFDRSL